jgi:hypothetical protein
MAYDWLSVQARANAALDKYGMTAQLVRGGTDHSVKIIVADYKARERDGRLIQYTDGRLYMSVGTLAIEPNPETDKLKFQGTIYFGGRAVSGTPLRIMRADPVNPSGTTIVYTLQVRA